MVAVAGSEESGAAGISPAPLLPCASSRASRVRCPLLIQVALADSVAAPSACSVAADRAPRAELVSYPIAHFDIYLGEPRERAIADQLAFLERSLGSPAPNPIGITA